jgi:hypothetical protein
MDSYKNMYFLCTIQKCQSYNTSTFIRLSVLRDWYNVIKPLGNDFHFLSCNNLIIQTDWFNYTSVIIFEVYVNRGDVKLGRNVQLDK